MSGINNPFTGSWFEHDQGAYAVWVDRQANLRAAREAADERRAAVRAAARSRRVRSAGAARPAVLPHG